MWAMEKDTDITISTLKVDGGASRDHFLMQFQSDILNKEVLRPAIRESGLGGARGVRQKTSDRITRYPPAGCRRKNDSLPGVFCAVPLQHGRV